MLSGFSFNPTSTSTSEGEVGGDGGSDGDGEGEDDGEGEGEGRIKDEEEVAEETSLGIVPPTANAFIIVDANTPYSRPPRCIHVLHYPDPPFLLLPLILLNPMASHPLYLVAWIAGEPR